MRRFPRSLLVGPVDEVAPRLLGALLVSDVGGERVAVRITEVEAYGGVGEDEASHAHRGPTRRNVSMFGRAGMCYIYRIYGMHWCLNVVVGRPGTASAVLLRAGEVVEGHDVAHRRRPAARADRDLARGPARLAAALGVDGRLDGADLLAGGPLRLQRAATSPGTARSAVVHGPRIGITRAVDRPWRWWWDGNPTVSRHRSAGG